MAQQGAKDVATDALGAAASAAAGVVLGRVSEALGSGQKKVDEALPEARQAVSTTNSRQKPAKKRLKTKKGVGTQARAAKKRGRARSSTGQASRKNTSARKSGAKKKAGRVGRGSR